MAPRKSGRKGSRTVKYDATTAAVNSGNLSNSSASPVSLTTAAPAANNKGKSVKTKKKRTQSRPLIISESSSSSDNTSDSDEISSIRQL